MRYQPRHAKQEPKRWRPKKTSRFVIMCISILYLLIVSGATIYSLTIYQNKLPQVELLQEKTGKIPATCLEQSANGVTVLNTVERQDGPWGNRYVVRQVTVYSYEAIDENTFFVYEALTSSNPIILSSTADYLYNGMEVRIA